MNDISNGARLENLFPELSAKTLNQETAKDNKELGKTQFLELMIAQLENQDPLAPKENGEFIAQLAQFSSLEGINNLNDTVGGLAGAFQSSVALQASSLVGRQVVVPATTAQLSASGTLDGSVQLTESSADLNVTVFDSTGRAVRNLALGPVPAGNQPFSWDGLDAEGNRQPAGTYSVRAEGRDSDQPVQLITELSADVHSVTVGADQSITLNLAGGGSVPISQVSEFR